MRSLLFCLANRADLVAKLSRSQPDAVGAESALAPADAADSCHAEHDGCA